MRTSSAYPAGVPCWVDTFQPDPEAAMRFYGPLLGWTFDDPVEMPDGLDGEYRTARLGGRTVAGVGQAPGGFPSAAWTTYLAVDDVDESAERAAGAGGGCILAPTAHRSGGRLAVLTDPLGVVFGIRRIGVAHGAELVNAPGSWTMSSLHTPARDASAAFYEPLFGWTLEDVPDTSLAFWRLHGYCGGTVDQPMRRDVVAVLAEIVDGDPTPPHWSVALNVADVDATAGRASELGGAVLLTPMDTPGFRSAVIADPHGGVVALTTPRTTAA